MSPEVVVFIVFGAAALAGGVAMVLARNPVFSAMGLLLSMFSVGVFYVLNNAHFVAAVHVLIYAGAVMTLFLFVIMLIGVDKSEDTEEQIPHQRPLAIALGVGLLALVLVAGRAAWVTGNAALETAVPIGTIENISGELFGTWLLPFEATVLLLTIAAVGTIALAQFSPRRRGGDAVEAVTAADEDAAESVVGS